MAGRSLRSYSPFLEMSPAGDPSYAAQNRKFNDGQTHLAVGNLAFELSTGQGVRFDNSPVLVSADSKLKDYLCKIKGN